MFLYFFNEGKNNNNIKGLEGFIEEIKQKFEGNNLEELIYQNEICIFPRKAMIKINNKDINVPVKWKDTKIATNKLGNFVFEGVSEEYERSVKLTVDIIPKIASIKEISTSIIQGQEYNLILKVTATFK